MARPMKFDKEEAIEVALQEIWRNGYEATSVKSLSEKLGIERASFYNTFGSREEMFKLALNRYGYRAPVMALYDMDRDEPLKPIITRMFRDLCIERSTDPDHRGCFGNNSLAEFGPNQQALLDHTTSLFLMDCEKLTQRITDAIKRGELSRDVDPNALALSVHNLLIGTNLQAKVVHDGDRLWSGVKTTLEALDLLDEGGSEGCTDDRQLGTNE